MYIKHENPKVCVPKVPDRFTSKVLESLCTKGFVHLWCKKEAKLGFNSNSLRELELEIFAQQIETTVKRSGEQAKRQTMKW